MGQKITKEFLKEKEKRVNLLFKSCDTTNEVRVSERADYTAIDMYEDGQLKDTLGGFSKKEANIMLNGLIAGATVCQFKKK